VTPQLLDEAEIVVVGAGPAGSACARRLASAGHDVLLVDRSTFPRDKPCGDGLTQSAVAELSDLGLDDLIAARPPIEGLRIVSGSGSSEYRPYGERTTARCIPRMLLDERLLESALREGVRFRHARVERVTPDERHPAVVLADPAGGEQSTIRARLVVAADGATSRLARDLGWAKQTDAPTAYAVRAYFTSGRELEPVFDIYLPLEFEDRRIPGYGWVFPIEPRVANIGVGYWRAPGASSPTSIREVLDGFVQRLQYKTTTRFGDLEIQSPLFGSPLGVQFNVDRCEGEGVLFVGDAARTTDPASGEGIAYALAGARIVADIVMRRRRGVEVGRQVGRAFAQRFPCLLQDVALPLRILEHRYNGVSRNARKTSEYPFVRTMRGVLTTPELVSPLADSVSGSSVSAPAAGEWLAAVDAHLMGSVGTSFPLATQMLSSKLRFGAGPALSLAFWSLAGPADTDCASLDCATALELIRVGTSLARDTIDRPAGRGASANNAMCLLIGDFAFSRAIHHASAVGPAFAKTVGAAIQRGCNAHFAESMTYFQQSRSSSDIIQSALGRTSLLLRLAVEAAGAETAAGLEALSRYARYADELGIAIRLAEDLVMLLVGDDATGQLAGGDLAVGAYPAAVLWSASHDPGVHAMLYDGNRPIDVARLTERIVECGGVNHAMEEVEGHANSAKQALVESDPAALTELVDAVVNHARSAARVPLEASMNFKRDAHPDGPAVKRDERGAVPNGNIPPVEHHEDSIETLFREHLAQTYGSSLQVPATAAASSQRLRAVWDHCGAPVAYDGFVQDVFAALQHAYDQKYGVWDDVNDLRTLYPDSWYTSILPHTSSLRPGARILGVGINDGREIRQLFDDRRANLDVLDLSAKAIGRLAHQLRGYSHIRSFVGTFEDWVPDYDEYDLFFSLRTLNCTAVDRNACVHKSIELVKPGGTLIYSVANGYVYMDNGVPKALNGMFSYETGTIDVQRPREIANEIRDEVDAAGARVLELAECPTEIFVVAAKERPPRAASDGVR
jgi:geranylgeranyl reductase family protein